MYKSGVGREGDQGEMGSINCVIVTGFGARSAVLWLQYDGLGDRENENVTCTVKNHRDNHMEVS